MNLLVATPIPYTDESPLGLIYRTAAANGVGSSTELLSILGIHNPLTVVISNTDTLVNCDALDLSYQDKILSYKPTRTFKPTYQFNHVHVDRKLLSLRKRRNCQHCIKELGYAHYSWDYQLITVCPTHSVKLASQCSDCGKEFDWSGALFTSCQCGSKTTSTKATKEEVSSQKYIKRWLENGDQEKIDILEEVFFALEKMAHLHDTNLDINKRIKLAVLSITDKSEFTKTIIKLLNKARLFPRIAVYSLLVSKVRYIHNIAENIVKEYSYKPQKNDVPDITFNQYEVANVLNISTKQVQQLLQKKLITGEKSSSNGNWKIPIESINALLKNIQSLVTKATSKETVSIKKILSHPLHHQNLADIIETAITNHYPIASSDHSKGLLGINFAFYKSPKIQSMLITDTYLTIHEASVEFKHKEHHLRALANTPYLPSAKLPINSTLKLIKREDIELFDKKYVIGPELASETSHSRTSFCLKLIEYGITPVSGPRIDYNDCYIFKREDLLGLDFDKIEKITLVHTSNRPGRPLKTLNQPTIDLPYVTFDEVNKQLNIDKVQLRNLLKRKLLRKHQYYFYKPVVSRVSFDELVNTLTSDEYIIRDDLVKQLKMTRRSFNNKFVLTGICFIKDVYLEKLIPSSRYEDIIKFHNTYLTTAEANLLFPDYANQIANLEKQGLIRPKLIKKVTNKGSFRFWKKSDVYELAKIHAPVSSKYLLVPSVSRTKFGEYLSPILDRK